ncbi:MAG: tRNA 2-selenouridine synthase [Pseudobdellovibrio sp.]|jgi:tRNA 2-selenouridine synthase|nr:tRNA 2-selenouridine synthase [Pseudobdellovibrio sp.]
MKRLSDFSQILLERTPLIDVRAPVEFAEGSLPLAENFPLMTDDERHEVGIMYKEKGQQAAIELGHRFVSGPVKEARVQQWINFIKENPGCAIYCFRGGLRSRITQQWLHDAGYDVPVIEGGYKAVRRFLLDSMAELLLKLNFRIIGGPTGSGKTQYIRTKKYFIDLESIAHHRGSAFGSYTDKPQPTQINFENLLILEMLRLKNVNEPIFLESESRMIGRCALPVSFHEKMLNSPREEISRPVEERVQNIYAEYILESPLGTQNDAAHFAHLQKSLDSISRKLGGLRHKEITEDLHFSKSEFLKNGTLESNKIWIEKLLLWYYDPLYNHSRLNHKARLT